MTTLAQPSPATTPSGGHRLVPTAEKQQRLEFRCGYVHWGVDRGGQECREPLMPSYPLVHTPQNPRPPAVEGPSLDGAREALLEEPASGRGCASPAGPQGGSWPGPCFALVPWEPVALEAVLPLPVVGLGPGARLPTFTSSCSTSVTSHPHHQRCLGWELGQAWSLSPSGDLGEWSWSSEFPHLCSLWADDDGGGRWHPPGPLRPAGTAPGG